MIKSLVKAAFKATTDQITLKDAAKSSRFNLTMVTV